MNWESRPEAALKVLAGGLNYSKDTGPTADPAEHFRNCFAVLVRGKSVRRHLYLNLPAAERAVKRALARGDQAELVLVQLVPVDRRGLDREIRRAGTDDALRALDDGGLL